MGTLSSPTFDDEVNLIILHAGQSMNYATFSAISWPEIGNNIDFIHSRHPLVL